MLGMDTRAGNGLETPMQLPYNLCHGQKSVGIQLIFTAELRPCPLLIGEDDEGQWENQLFTLLCAYIFQ